MKEVFAIYRESGAFNQYLMKSEVKHITNMCKVLREKLSVELTMITKREHEVLFGK